MVLLNPAMRELGLEPPAPVLPKKGDPARALMVMGAPAGMMPAMTRLAQEYAGAAAHAGQKAALQKMDSLGGVIVKHDVIMARLKAGSNYVSG
jgi:hypothetical protein